MDGTSVTVMALFRHGELIPKAFRVGGRTTLVERVTLKYATKDGGVSLWYFNVETKMALHTLVYDPERWRWRLVASWDPAD